MNNKRLMTLTLTAMMLASSIGSPVSAYAGEQNTGSAEIIEEMGTAEENETADITENMAAEEAEQTGESSEAENTAQAEESSDAEEAAQAEDRSDAEEAAQAEDRSDAEDTAQTEESSEAEDTAQTEESSEAEEAAQAEESSKAEDTTQAEESSALEEASAQAAAAETASANVSIQSINMKKGKAKICIEDITATAGLKKVEAAVWSSSDKTDLKWYTAKKALDGKYYFTMSISDFQYNWAEYQCHVYLTDKAGTKTDVASTTVDFTLKSEELQVTTSKDMSTAVVSIKLTQVPAGFKGLKAAVWSLKNDQDDLTWYSLTYDEASGAYTVSVPLSNLKDLGKYTVDIYAKSKNGSSVYLTGKTCEANCSCTSATLKDIGSEGAKQTVYKGKIKGVTVPGGYTSIQAAVWSASGGKDDLKWYNLKEQSDGTWSFILKIANHKTAGKYFCRYYAVRADGSKELIAKCDSTVIDGLSETPTIKTTSAGTGKFNVTISGLSTPSGITKVPVAVWRKSDQSDMKWYTAEKQKDGTYQISVNIADHQYLTGAYTIHVYAETGNGQNIFAGGEKYSCKVSSGTVLVSGAKTDNNRKVIYYNKNVKSVRFAVWSETGGQDDLTWINATKTGSGVWTADIDSTIFLHNGSFNLHVYSGNTCLATKTFKWNGDLSQACVYAKAVLDQVGWNLQAAFNWSKSLPYELSAGYPNSLPAGICHSEYYALYGFTHHTGSCYVMASTFMYMARLLGYDAYLVEGEVPYRTGGYGPHGWVEIVINGTTYVYDPDFEYNTGCNGFHLTYGASGTWIYTNYHRVA